MIRVRQFLAAAMVVTSMGVTAMAQSDDAADTLPDDLGPRPGRVVRPALAPVRRLPPRPAPRTAAPLPRPAVNVASPPNVNRAAEVTANTRDAVDALLRANAAAAPAPAPAPVPAVLPRAATPLQLAAPESAPASNTGWKLLVCGMLIAAGVYFVRKRQQLLPGVGPQDWRLVVHRRTAVGSKGELLLVEAAGQHLLVGVTSNGIQTLAVLQDSATVIDADAHPLLDAPESSPRFSLQAPRDEAMDDDMDEEPVMRHEHRPASRPEPRAESRVEARAQAQKSESRQDARQASNLVDIAQALGARSGSNHETARSNHSAQNNARNQRPAQRGGNPSGGGHGGSGGGGRNDDAALEEQARGLRALRGAAG